MRQLVSNSGTDYLAFAITALIALIATLIYLFWTERRHGKLSFPGLDPTDDNLGNITDVKKAGGFSAFLRDNHKKYGPIFSFYWQKELCVSLASPELWKDVVALFDRPVNKSLVFLNLISQQIPPDLQPGEKTKHRRLLDKLYSAEAIKSLATHFEQVAEELKKKWGSIPAEEHVPLGQHMSAIALKSVLRAAFGSNFFKTNKEMIELQSAYDTYIEEVESCVDGNIPDESDEREKDFQRAMKEITMKMKEVISACRNSKGKDVTLVNIILNENILNDSDEQIFDIALTYLIDGFQLTSSILTWSIYYLCNNPEILKKIQEEIAELVGERQVSINDVEKLRFMQLLIDETLRCASVTPYDIRFAEMDVIIGGHLVPKKTPMVLALESVMHNAEIWTEPNSFDPKRFTPDQSQTRHPLSFQPFGFSGKRKSIGYRSSYFEAILYLAVIIQNFHFELAPGQEPEPVHGFTTQPKEEIFITIRKR